MSDLKVIIKKSAATRALTNLANVETDMLYLNIPSADATAAQTEMATMDDEDFTVSNTVIETNGFTNDGLLLPKKVLG